MEKEYFGNNVWIEFIYPNVIAINNAGGRPVYIPADLLGTIKDYIDKSKMEATKCQR